MGSKVKHAIRQLFWNHAEQRVRALWRLVLQAAAFALGILVIRASLGWLSESFSLPMQGNYILFFTAYLGLMVTTCLGAARWLDRRNPAGIGLKVDAAWCKDAAVGAALGAIAITAIVGLEVQCGWTQYRWAPTHDFGWSTLLALGTTVYVFIVVGIVEELWFRGYQLTNLAEGFHAHPFTAAQASMLAALLSSLIFGLAHFTNPDASVTSTLNISLAGIMLCWPYLLTQRLGFSIGLHITWNLTQNLFGMPVSGQTLFHFGALFTRETPSATWLTGGPFGPEAGLTGLGAMVALLIAIGGWAWRKNGHWRIHADLGHSPRAIPQPTSLAPESHVD